MKATTDSSLKERLLSPCQGAFTVLIGEANTFKSRISRSFLSQGFVVDGKKKIDRANSGVAVLITTQLLDRDLLVEKLLTHLQIDDQSDPNYNRNMDLLHERVICRRLSARHMASSNLLEIIEKHIELARSKVIGNDPARVEGSRIRLVIDDWSVILASHSNIAPDAYLLPSIVAILKRERLNSLIVSTQDVHKGSEGVFAAVGTPNDLRQLDEQQIHTWIVPFFGENCVAISTHVSTRRAGIPRVFEIKPVLKNDKASSEMLRLDRHFELYADLDQGQPIRIPLFVRLYGGNHGVNRDEKSRVMFPDAIRSTMSQVFSVSTPQTEVVSFEPFTKYDELFAFADSLDDSRIDHTMVFQVDEFWSEDRRSLLDLNRYYNYNITAKRQNNRERWNTETHRQRSEDSFGHFQPHNAKFGNSDTKEIPKITASQSGKTTLTRKDFFWDSPVVVSPHRTDQRTDRIPYLWDFGFILAERDLWEPHAMRQVGYIQGAPVYICQIWNCLDRSETAGALPMKSLENDKLLPLEEVTWIDFFAACRIVGEEHGIASFDCDLSTGESLSCLLLEIWASTQKMLEKRLNSTHDSLDVRDPFCFTELSVPPAGGLKRLVEKFQVSLFFSLVLLLATSPHICARNRAIRRRHVSSRSAASRHWYHTASAKMREKKSSRYSILRLPGNFSIRGDWSLSIAAGSRSELLGHLALDTLSSRRMNLLRMQDGIGLPVRDIVEDGKLGEIPTALKIRDFRKAEARTASFGEICKLGGHLQSLDFNWAFRSRIQKYDRDSFYWRRWIARMIEEKGKFWPVEKHSAKALCDLESRLDELLRVPSNNREYASEFSSFKERLDLLGAVLRD